MSYTSTDLITYAVGDGTTGTIQTPPFEVDSDIVVLVRESGEDTADTWVLDTDYTLAGAGTGANGTLTPITTKPDGATIVVYTDPAPTLTFDFSALPSALQSPLKSALHQIQLQVRSLKAAQRQYIKTSIFDLVAKNNTGTAAIDADRLGKLLLWNATTGAPDVIDPGDVTGTFLQLTDTPASFSGAGGYHVKVNSGADGLEFVATPGVYDQFTDLTDTPNSLSGSSLKLLRANLGETALEFFTYEAPNLGRDGRTILEVGSVSDASAEFLSGATFEINPADPRHYNLQVGDASTPLTANMVVDLVPDSADWPETANVIINKGSDDAYTVTITGLNVDGLGTITLTDQHQYVILNYQHTDGTNGPGAAGQKFAVHGRSSKTVADLRAVAAQRLVYKDDDGDPSGLSVGTGLAIAGGALTATGGVSFDVTTKTGDYTLTSAEANGTLVRMTVTAAPATVELPVNLTGRNSWFIWVSPDNTQTVDLTITDTILQRTGDLTEADETVANIDTTNLEVGFGVTGEGIPGSTTIATVGSGTIELSAAVEAEGTGTGVLLTIDAGKQGEVNGWAGGNLPLRLRAGLTVVEQLSEGYGPIFAARGDVVGGNQVPQEAETASFNVDKKHLGAVTVCTSGSGINITVRPDTDLPIPAKSWMKVIPGGAGALTFVEGSGVTIHPAPGYGLVSAGQWAPMTLTWIAANTYVLEGSAPA